MKLEYAVQEGLSHTLSSIWMMKRYEMCKLSQLIDNYHDAIGGSEVGNPSMKSIDIICHASVGTGRGDKRPGYRARSGFACLQTEHEATKDLTDCFIPFQKNSFLTRQ